MQLMTGSVVWPNAAPLLSYCYTAAAGQRSPQLGNYHGRGREVQGRSEEPEGTQEWARIRKVTNYSFIFSRLNDTKEGEEVYGI